MDVDGKRLTMRNKLKGELAVPRRVAGGDEDEDSVDGEGYCERLKVLF